MSAPKDKNIIHVVFAADANYAMPLAVAICSTANNCDRKRKIVFHVIQSGIGQELRAKVERSLECAQFPDAQIIWLDAPLDRIRNFKLGHRYTTVLTFARLLIAELLPQQVRKTLYLDCDIVVLEDIAPLWDIDIDEKSLFAARDTVDNVANPVGGIPHYRELGIPPDTHLFNAGVLLMNLQKWRDNDLSTKLLDYLTTYSEVVRMADQEALNALLYDDWRELDFRWNWQIPWRGVRRGTHRMDWTPGTSRKSIVHFISSEKPWLPGCDYAEKRYFFEYLDQTEWAGWRVPAWEEFVGRFRRGLQDARDAFGRVRRWQL